MKASVSNNILYWTSVAVVLPHPRSSPYSPIYRTFFSQTCCNSFINHQAWLLQLHHLHYCKQGYSKMSTCSKLFGMGRHAFSVLFFSHRAASEIIALAPCTLPHYFQELYNNISNPLIDTTSISGFDITYL